MMESNPRKKSSSVETVHEVAEISADVAACQSSASAELSFAVRYKDWIDEQHSRFEKYGLWNDDLRLW
jgi:hypothetical protein